MDRYYVFVSSYEREEEREFPAEGFETQREAMRAARDEAEKHPRDWDVCEIRRSQDGGPHTPTHAMDRGEGRRLNGEFVRVRA